MSWESTAVYYRRLNELTRDRLGALASASLLLRSFDFQRIEELQRAEAWTELSVRLGKAGAGLAAAGARFLILATNTMHLVADKVQALSGIPILHIADATGAEIAARGMHRVGLLGTRFTMEHGFYVDRLRERFGIDCTVPEPADRSAVDRIIYEELCAGIVSETSQDMVARIIAALIGAGAEAIVLGCTELPLLVEQANSSVPLIDTSELHCRAAVERALKT